MTVERARDEGTGQRVALGKVARPSSSLAPSRERLTRLCAARYTPPGSVTRTHRAAISSSSPRSDLSMTRAVLARRGPSGSRGSRVGVGGSAAGEEASWSALLSLSCYAQPLELAGQGRKEDRFPLAGHCGSASSFPRPTFRAQWANGSEARVDTSYRRLLLAGTAIRADCVAPARSGQLRARSPEQACGGLAVEARALCRTGASLPGLRRRARRAQKPSRNAARGGRPPMPHAPRRRRSHLWARAGLPFVLERARASSSPHTHAQPCSRLIVPFTLPLSLQTPCTSDSRLKTRCSRLTDSPPSRRGSGSVARFPTGLAAREGYTVIRERSRVRGTAAKGIQTSSRTGRRLRGTTLATLPRRPRRRPRSAPPLDQVPPPSLRQAGHCTLPCKPSLPPHHVRPALPSARVPTGLVRPWSVAARPSLQREQPSSPHDWRESRSSRSTAYRYSPPFSPASEFPYSPPPLFASAEPQAVVSPFDDGDTDLCDSRGDLGTPGWSQSPADDERATDAASDKGLAYSSGALKGEWHAPAGAYLHGVGFDDAHAHAPSPGPNQARRRAWQPSSAGESASRASLARPRLLALRRSGAGRVRGPRRRSSRAWTRTGGSSRRGGASACSCGAPRRVARCSLA